MSTSEESLAKQQQIVVPHALPMMLKEFCKAAIRTQPYDLLKWSRCYFRALADGEEPPIKLRLEYPPPSTRTGLTLGFLRVLLRQFGDYNKLLAVEAISQRWDCLGLNRKDLGLIMTIGRFGHECQVKKFLAIAVGLLGSSLLETMIMICELFTHELAGGSAMIPITLFMEIYGYLAGLRCDGSERSITDEPSVESPLSEQLASNPSQAVRSKSADPPDPWFEQARSIASQDTDADINLDLELESKEDPLPSKSNDAASSPRLPDSTMVNQEQEGTEDKVKEQSSSSGEEGTLKNDDQITSQQGTEKNSIDMPGTTENSAALSARNNQTPPKCISNEPGSTSPPGIKSKSERVEERQIRSADKKGRRINRKHYPNVPGIGPRLSAEQVASVAIWLSECARLQEGMVGPRNLRHINCPPLDKEDSNGS